MSSTPDEPHYAIHSVFDQVETESGTRDIHGGMWIVDDSRTPARRVVSLDGHEALARIVRVLDDDAELFDIAEGKP